MKPLFLFPVTQNAGGIEKHYYHLIKNLDRQKFKIHVGLYEGSPLNFGPLPHDVGVLYLSGSYFEMGKVLKQYFKKHAIETVYSCSFESSMPLFIASMLGSKFRLVLGKRGSLKYNRKRKFFDHIFQIQCDKVLCNSHAVKVSLNSIGRSKSDVIYNTLDETFVSSKNRDELRAELNLNQDHFVIGTIGRLSEVKGHKYLIDAFSKLSRERSDIRLLLIGDGELDAQLKAQVKELDIEDKVIFAGNRENGGGYALAMDLFVLPSLSESMPNALLEAMYLGIPVISTAVGGVPEIVSDEKEGLLIKNIADSDEIYNQIKKFFAKQSLAANWTIAAKKQLDENFDFNKNLSRLEDEFSRTK